MSQYLCIGKYSAVTFQVLGNMKTVLVLVLGFTFFGREGLSVQVRGMNRKRRRRIMKRTMFYWGTYISIVFFIGEKHCEECVLDFMEVRGCACNSSW